MAKTPSKDKEELLINLLKKKCAYYTAVLELSVIEQEKIQHHAPLNEILSQMHKKQILLDCADQIENELSPLKLYWKTKSTHTDLQSLQIKELLHSLDALMQKILSLSNCNQLQFEGLLSQLRSKQKNFVPGHKNIE